jgi:hypothetical protein
LKLQDAIRRKRPGQLERGVLLHHDNARLQTDRATQERIQELQWEFLEHLPYSPDLYVETERYTDHFAEIYQILLYVLVLIIHEELGKLSQYSDGLQAGWLFPWE